MNPLTGLPGNLPQTPPWGQELVSPTRELLKRIKHNPETQNKAAIVFGGGGAFAPDLINALVLRGYGAVIGVDTQLTYPVEKAGYRYLDLCDGKSVEEFIRDVLIWIKDESLSLGAIYDLATIQTNPRRTNQDHRNKLIEGSKHLSEALCGIDDDVKYFYMSTAEIYGAQPGAPYKEDHQKKPFNAYAEAKWAEEQEVMNNHGNKTRGGKLYITALRTWTISMVNEDEDGNITSSRNYNDPLISIAASLARMGMKIPVIDKDMKAQFHLSEEVAEVCVLMGEAGYDSGIWGKAWNCIGQAGTHGELADITFELFPRKKSTKSMLPGAFGFLSQGGTMQKSIMKSAVKFLEFSGGLFGARGVAGRLPFLYSSTDVDSSALRKILGDTLTVPEGSHTSEAVKRLCQGVINGGKQALNFRRYDLY